MTDTELDTIIEALKNRDTAAWDMAVSYGIKTREDDERKRWHVGDICLAIEPVYGENSIGAYAKSTKRAVKTVYEYREMAAFFPFSARQNLFEFANVTYSHMRTAMRYFPSLEHAVAFIEECADGDYSVEKARIVAKKRNGKPTPPPKLLDAIGCLKHVDTETGVIAFQAAPGADLMKLQNYLDQELRLALYALEPEKESENGQS